MSVSVYADRVPTYGQHWYRPWIALLGVGAIVGALAWTAASPHGRPVSVTIDATRPHFTLPPPSPSRFRVGVEREGGLVWTADLHAALAQAYRHREWIFVAIHAVWDTNSSRNEDVIANEKRIRECLGNYRLVWLDISYVRPEFYENVPAPSQCEADGKRFQKFHRDLFGTEQEPLYAILRPTGANTFQIHAVYEEAIINDIDRFVRFLRKPQTRVQ